MFRKFERLGVRVDLVKKEGFPAFAAVMSQIVV